MRGRGFIRVDGLKAKKGSSLIMLFNGEPIFTEKNSMVAKASGVKVYVGVGGEWVEVDEMKIVDRNE